MNMSVERPGLLSVSYRYFRSTQFYWLGFLLSEQVGPLVVTEPSLMQVNALLFPVVSQVHVTTGSSVA